MTSPPWRRQGSSSSDCSEEISSTTEDSPSSSRDLHWIFKVGFYSVMGVMALAELRKLKVSDVRVFAATQLLRPGAEQALVDLRAANLDYLKREQAYLAETTINNLHDESPRQKQLHAEMTASHDVFMEVKKLCRVLSIAPWRIRAMMNVS